MTPTCHPDKFWSIAAANNVHDFLQTDLAKELYKPGERQIMRQFADAMRAQVPMFGTNNPSGTAPMMARIGRMLMHGVLPAIGAAEHRLTGAVAGLLANQAANLAGQQSNLQSQTQLGTAGIGAQATLGAAQAGAGDETHAPDDTERRRLQCDAEALRCALHESPRRV
jgi:hypothetical protein